MMHPAFRRWLVLLLLLARPVGAADALAQPVWGTWEGNYVCGQGNTALTLTLRPGREAGTVDGLFHFHASPGNPGVPEGCFTMTGTVPGPDGKLDLSAARWLLRPFGYVSVDLSGQLSGDRLSGEVIGPLCSDFEVHRVSPAPLPAVCADAPTVSSR